MPLALRLAHSILPNCKVVDNLREARSNKMSKNGNDIFVGEFNVSDDKCDGSDKSESSSDSSSSEERYKKTSKRVQIVRMTPVPIITLQPDAFRGAMNPDETVSSVDMFYVEGNEMRQNICGANANVTLTTIRNYCVQIMTVPNLIEEIRTDLEPILEVIIFLDQITMVLII